MGPKCSHRHDCHSWRPHFFSRFATAEPLAGRLRYCAPTMGRLYGIAILSLLFAVSWASRAVAQDESEDVKTSGSLERNSRSAPRRFSMRAVFGRSSARRIPSSMARAPASNTAPAAVCAFAKARPSSCAPTSHGHPTRRRWAVTSRWVRYSNSDSHCRDRLRHPQCRALVRTVGLLLSDPTPRKPVECAAPLVVETDDEPGLLSPSRLL